VVVPIASGALLTKIALAFRQLAAVGLIEEHDVRASGAQAAGCAPVATAFAEGTDEVRPVRYPETIAKSLAIGDPADGYYALQEVRESGGAVASVSEEEIVEAVGLLAGTEGIFTETAGGVTVGTLSHLAANGAIRPDETVVAYITGMGLKTLEGFGDRFRPRATISAKVEALAEVVPW
jgi:threonine synthase